MRKCIFAITFIAVKLNSSLLYELKIYNYFRVIFYCNKWFFSPSCIRSGSLMPTKPELFFRRFEEKIILAAKKPLVVIYIFQLSSFTGDARELVSFGRAALASVSPRGSQRTSDETRELSSVKLPLMIYFLMIEPIFAQKQCCSHLRSAALTSS